MATYQDLKVNKITKEKFDELVANGTITQDMITSQAWLFTDDQFISKSDINRWNNKADSDAIPTKLSQLTNDTNYAKTSDIPTKTSQLINDSNYAEVSDIPTNLSQLKNDVGYANKSEIPTKLSELSNDANYAKTYDIPTKLSELANDSGFITDFIETDPTVPSWAKQETKPTYSKEEVGLGNVENKSSETIRSEITSKNVTDALGYTPLSTTMKGIANGLAELDVNGKVPASQLPSYVDDVLEYNTKSSFPTTGEGGKIYVALDTNLVYRWSGTSYVAISSPLALGETSSSAFRGDLGKIAYDHSQAQHAPVNAQENIIERINVNGTQQAVTNKEVNIVVPTNLSQLTNDADYAKKSELPTKTSQLINDNNYITASDIPTNVSQFNNDAGYITKSDVPTKLSELTNDAGYAKTSEIPTKLSELTNDANYAKTSQLHSHANKAILDGISQDDIDYWNDKTAVADTLPIGTIIEYPVLTPPANWLVCNGQAVSRTTYAKLFAVIGTTYGAGDGSTTFNLPTKEGLVTVGRKASDTDFATLGQKGGEKTHTLTIEELPSHTHGIPAINWCATPGTNTIVAGSTWHTNSETQASVATGGGQPHNNLQPYVVSNYIIKADNTIPIASTLVHSLGNPQENTALSTYGLNKLLDSDYVKKSGDTISGHLYLDGVTDTGLQSTAKIIFGNATTNYHNIYSSKSGLYFGNSLTDGSKAMGYDSAANAWRPTSTNSEASLGTASNHWAKAYIDNITGELNGNAKSASNLKVVCRVGSDESGLSRGWYKVATQTMSGYGNTNILYYIKSGYNSGWYGLLELELRSDNTSISCYQCEWVVRSGFSKDHIRVVIDGMTWTLYVYNPSIRYGRTYFTEIQHKGIGGGSTAWPITYFDPNNTLEETEPIASYETTDAIESYYMDEFARGQFRIGDIPATKGWYRIAQTELNIGNNIGQFIIQCHSPGYHSVTNLSATLCYNQNPTLQQIAHSFWGSSSLTKARIVYDSAGYDQRYSYLEVYLNLDVSQRMSVQKLGNQGWELITPTTGGVPDGFTTKELNLATGKFVGNLNGTADSALISDRVDVTNTNTTAGATYYPTFVTGSGEGAIIRANNGIKYYSIEGTTSTVGRALIELGNNTSSGTAGNKRGELKIFSEKSGCTRVHTAATQTGDYTVYLPSASGTIALTSHTHNSLTSSLTTSTHLNGNKGTNVIINSTASAGYNMLARMKSTNGVYTLGAWNTTFNLFYTADTTISAGTNNYTKRVSLLNESGDSSFPGNVSASKFNDYTLAAACARGVKTLTAKSHSGFGTNNTYVPDMSFIAYWNGAYNSSNASNLTYCAAGTILATSSSTTYTKMSDGTLICYGTVSCPKASPATDYPVSVTLPQAFVNTSYRVTLTKASHINYYASIEEVIQSKTTTKFTVNFYNTEAAGSGNTTPSALVYDYIAIGRWK